jgi:hypothetical protein
MGQCVKTEEFKQYINKNTVSEQTTNQTTEENK